MQTAWYAIGTMSKKIVVLLGNPDADTYSGRLADAYQVGAEDAGHEVIRFNIGDMDFDPVLHKGYKEIQTLEPELVRFQEAVQEADHLVIVYPNWWNTMPAKLKGLFDRAWLPGFAFNFEKADKKIIQRLTGKTARVIITSGTYSPFKTWWQFGDFTNEIQHGILNFAGLRTKVSAYGPCEKVGDSCREKWIDEVEQLGRKAC